MIRVIAAGKIRESWMNDAVAEYSKRIGAYTRFEIEQVPDEKCPENLSDIDKSNVLNKEGARILSHISDREYVITLEILGKQMSSEQFAAHLESLRREGHSRITFVIGGSLGLAQKVSDRADFRLSFSDMTFPHQLMRVILLEQIYRSFKIAKNEPYHK